MKLKKVQGVSKDAKLLEGLGVCTVLCFKQAKKSKQKHITKSFSFNGNSLVNYEKLSSSRIHFQEKLK